VTVEEPLRSDGAAVDAPPPSPSVAPEHPPERARVEPPEGDRARSPSTDWPPWSAFAALIGGLVLAAVGGLAVELPALALGVKITSSHTPRGIAVAATFVQDVAFVAAAVYCAHIGGRVVRAWQFGLRAPGRGWRAAVGGVVVLLVVFALLSLAWTEVFNPSREKVLNQLGSGVLSAALVCVVAPFCEELLFRGYIFTALRNWRGTLPAALITAALFGGVHAGSAPALDLVPLAALGFGLCMLYRYTGSLYPCMAAHSLNNSVAFASLADLTLGETVLLAVGALAGIAAVALAGRRIGLTAAAHLARPAA
jgi:membrane protease YdiL (CAAX protease family)